MPLFGSATPATAASLNANYFMAWWSAVYARLAYLNPQQFLGRYTEIYGDGTTGSGELPTAEVLGMINKQATTKGIAGLLDDETMLQLVNNFKPGQKRWGLNVVEVAGINATPPKASMLTLDCITNYDATTGQATDAYGNFDQVASWAEKVNIALGERRRIAEDKKNPATTTPEMLNCAPALVLKDNPQLVFRAISDSNYGTTYVFGDKRAPNLTHVVFRGTANAKSAFAYTRPSSLTPTKLVDFFGTIDAGLIGIFKILQEQIHVIIQMAIDVAHELNGANIIAPGSIKLITTGHSLGGAMATAFAGEYVQQISPNLASIAGATIFDVNIGCYSLASPRVFGPKEAALFCCLTQARDLCQKDPAAADYVKTDSNVKGRISYLRVVTTLDLVTALPKGGYEHPCSEFTVGERDKITMDCDVDANKFIANKVSTRCLTPTHKRPAMTADFSKAPVCTNMRKKTWSVSSMLYHLTYCGIMFAGGVDMTSALSLDVERLQAADINAAAVDPVALKIKADDTMMRVLWYGMNDKPVAKCAFFDLTPFRVNETMTGGGEQHGGFLSMFKSKPAAAPPPATNPVPATNSATVSKPSGFGGLFKKTPAPTATASPVSTPTTAAPADASLLLEDSRMTSAFITKFKTDVANDAKYDYSILNVDFKPPILYKDTKGTFNYLYQLPATVAATQSRLFFGKNAPSPPPRATDASGSPILTPDETSILNHHNATVSATVAASTAPAPAPTVTATPATVTGGRRTRRSNSPKSCKHRKGKKSNKASISRRKCNKRHTKRI